MGEEKKAKPDRDAELLGQLYKRKPKEEKATK
jgi:hypothetical protein